jgi:hypothetical protein
MTDILSSTKMNEFVVFNNYQLPYLYFRALIFAADYEVKEQVSHDGQLTSSLKLTELNDFWGDLADYWVDSELDALAQGFESWCKDKLKSLTVESVTNIQFISSSDSKNNPVGTAYIVLDENKNIAAINETYKKELTDALTVINKKLKGKTLFSELTSYGSHNKVDNYELWLDAVLLADCNTKVGGSHDRLTTFLDIISTNKPCWNDFKKRYGRGVQVRIKNSDNPIHSEYDKSEYNDIILFKEAFDVIDGYINSGNELLKGILKDMKMRGRSTKIK